MNPKSLNHEEDALKPVSYGRRPCSRHGVIDVVHHVVCRHQVEVEIWPPRAEVNFRDEHGANPINTMIRFEATLFNATHGGVTWEVRNPAGNAGAGSIDASGLYRAPAKGTLQSGLTDVVIVTANEDPLRKAYAWVTLVGKGPAPEPQPIIEIWPKSIYLYYPGNQTVDDRNEFIDASNTMQMFRATIRNSAETQVEWRVDNVIQANGSPSSLFHYKVTGSGSTKVVVVSCRIQAQPAVHDDSKVILINYRWPKMKPPDQL